MSVDSPNEAPPASAIDSPPSRTAAWLPWVVVAVLTALVVGTLVLTDNSATVAEPVYPSDHWTILIRAVDLSDLRIPRPIWVVLLITIIDTEPAHRKTFSMHRHCCSSPVPPCSGSSGRPTGALIWCTTGTSWTVQWLDLDAGTRRTGSPVGAIFGYGIFFGVKC